MKFRFLFFIVFIFSQYNLAQEPVTFTTSVKKISSDTYELITNSKIEYNWRLYSQNLIDGGAIPTEFIFSDSNSYDLIGIVKESESVTKFDPIFGIDQSYFIDQSFFTQTIKINDISINAVKAIIAYQACDDMVCIFRESELVFNLDGSVNTIVNEDLSTLVIDESNPLVLDLKNTELLETYSSSEGISSNLYLNLLILGFLGGLLALLTPCVFPMIPLTVCFFTNKC
jgi:thiol:disulfide interchange protein